MNSEFNFEVSVFNARKTSPTVFSTHALICVREYLTQDACKQMTVAQIKQMIVDRWSKVTKREYLNYKYLTGVFITNWAYAQYHQSPKEQLAEIIDFPEDPMENPYDGVFSENTQDSALFGQIKDTFKHDSDSPPNTSVTSHQSQISIPSVTVKKICLKKQSRYKSSKINSSSLIHDSVTQHPYQDSSNAVSTLNHRTNHHENLITNHHVNINANIPSECDQVYKHFENNTPMLEVYTHYNGGDSTIDPMTDHYATHISDVSVKSKVKRKRKRSDAFEQVVGYDLNPINEYNHSSMGELSENHALMNPTSKKKRKTKAAGDKPDKDPNQPKKFAAAYGFYVQSKKSDPRARGKAGALVSLAAAEWKLMTDEEKRPFEEKSMQDKARYNEELEKLKRSKLNAANAENDVNQKAD